jgi:hypothetical protein
VVTGKAIELRELWPAWRIARLYASGELVQRFAQRHGLPYDQGVCSHPLAFGGFPVRWHPGTEGIELEGEEGMAGSEQLMIDVFLRISQVTGETLFRPLAEIANIVHAELN